MIPIKNGINSVLEASGDSGFKESLKWRSQVLELQNFLGWERPTRIVRSEKFLLFSKGCKIRLVDFEGEVVGFFCCCSFVWVFFRLIFFFAPPGTTKTLPVLLPPHLNSLFSING